MQDVCHQPYRIEVVLHQNYVDRVACLAHHSWYPATKLVPPFLGRFVSNSLQRISREGRRTSHSLGLPRSWFSRDGLDWWSVSRMQLLADSWISWWKVLKLKRNKQPKKETFGFWPQVCRLLPRFHDCSGVRHHRCAEAKQTCGKWRFLPLFLAQCYHVRVAKFPSNSLATTNCSSSGDSASEALLSELHRSDHVAWQSLQLKLTGLEDLASFSLGGHIFHTHTHTYMYICTVYFHGWCGVCLF